MNLLTRYFPTTALSLAFWCMAPATYAADIPTPTHHEKASYSIHYLGLAIGKIRLWWEEDATHYKVTASVKTSGIARVFSKQKREVVLYGVKQGKAFVPLTYDATVTYPHKERKTEIRYQDGKIADITITPPRDNPLTAEQQASATDPLTALLQVMHYAKTRQNAPLMFATEAFDGKRLNRIYALPQEGGEDCAPPCQRYQMHRKPLAGYNEEKLARYRKGEPPLLLSIYPQQSFFPHAMFVKTSIGKMEVVRVKE